MIDIKQSLPKSVTDIYEVSAVLEAINTELMRLYDTIEEANMDSSISGIRRNIDAWETDMGVPKQAFLGLEQRKNSLLAQMMCYQTQNEDTIRSAVTKHMGGGTTELMYEHSKYTLKVHAIMKNGLHMYVDALKETLRLALPAHIDIDLRYSSNLHGSMLNSSVLLCNMQQQIESEGL